MFCSAVKLQCHPRLQCLIQLTCSDVKRTSCGRAFSPFVFTSGNFFCRATITAYRFEIAPPGKKEEGQCPERVCVGWWTNLVPKWSRHVQSQWFVASSSVSRAPWGWKRELSRTWTYKRGENVSISLCGSQKRLCIYMFVLAAAVSHSPARETMSSPHDSWLK